MTEFDWCRSPNFENFHAKNAVQNPKAFAILIFHHYNVIETCRSRRDTFHALFFIRVPEWLTTRLPKPPKCLGFKLGRDLTSKTWFSHSFPPTHKPFRKFNSQPPWPNQTGSKPSPKVGNFTKLRYMHLTRNGPADFKIVFMEKRQKLQGSFWGIYMNSEKW